MEQTVLIHPCLLEASRYSLPDRLPSWAQHSDADLQVLYKFGEKCKMWRYLVETVMERPLVTAMLWAINVSEFVTAPVPNRRVQLWLDVGKKEKIILPQIDFQAIYVRDSCAAMFAAGRDSKVYLLRTNQVGSINQFVDAINFWFGRQSALDATLLDFDAQDEAAAQAAISPAAGTPGSVLLTADVLLEAGGAGAGGVGAGVAPGSVGSSGQSDYQSAHGSTGSEDGSIDIELDLPPTIHANLSEGAHEAQQLYYALLSLLGEPGSSKELREVLDQPFILTHALQWVDTVLDVVTDDACAVEQYPILAEVLFHLFERTKVALSREEAAKMMTHLARRVGASGNLRSAAGFDQSSAQKAGGSLQLSQEDKSSFMALLPRARVRKLFEFTAHVYFFGLLPHAELHACLTCLSAEPEPQDLFLMCKILNLTAFKLWWHPPLTLAVMPSRELLKQHMMVLKDKLLRTGEPLLDTQIRALLGAYEKGYPLVLQP